MGGEVDRNDVGLDRLVALVDADRAAAGQTSISGIIFEIKNGLGRAKSGAVGVTVTLGAEGES